MGQLIWEKMYVTAKAGFDTSNKAEERIWITLKAVNPNKAIHCTDMSLQHQQIYAANLKAVIYSQKLT